MPDAAGAAVVLGHDRGNGRVPVRSFPRRLRKKEPGVADDQKALTLAQRLDQLNEFEREPIAADKLHSGRYFAGLFSGEHIAATEFVIGVLFVQWGAGAKDLILGLLLGNLLAVLSWAFICSPIATRTRLTLYWYVRRIIGPGLTIVYNFINAILYCCLAAAMIGVSASAVFVALGKMGLHLQHPKLDDVLPNSVGWVVVVLIVGAVVVTLAIAGFKKLSQFASVCSPWMFLIFIAGALASLPGLGVKSFSDLGRVASENIWTGVPFEQPKREVTVPLPDARSPVKVPEELRKELAKEDSNWFDAVFNSSQIKLSPEATMVAEEPGPRWWIMDGASRYAIKYVSSKNDEGVEEEKLTACKVLAKLTFWYIAFFAWFCNLAMHIGLSDMAVFRYARHWSYGFYSAFGMYLGHYVAWVCAGVMGAAVGGGLNPGQMADQAAGYAGILAVLIAGWTTANPTIYRAGLALQIVTPNWPRWKVTLAAGLITTFVGFFPAIFMQLLNFVAIYGLCLMPIGAVIVMEHWVFPKLGLRQYWTETRSLLVNPAALISWVAVLVICFPIENFTGGRVESPMHMMGVHLFFRWLPGWFIASGLYLVICKVMAGRWQIKASADEGAAATAPHIDSAGPASQAAPNKPLPPIAWIAGAVSLISLILCLALPVSVFLGRMESDTYKTWLMVVTILYFVGAIVWMMQREKSRSATDQ